MIAPKSKVKAIFIDGLLTFGNGSSGVEVPDERMFIAGLNDMPANEPPKRRFTEAARAAALVARRRKRDLAAPQGTPEVFVVRQPSTNRGYGWEIRRFGGVVLDRSPTDYPTMHGAQSAGNAALGSRICGA